MISAQLAGEPLAILRLRADYGPAIPRVSTQQVLVGEKTEYARGATVHGVNVGLFRKLLLAHLKGVLN